MNTKNESHCSAAAPEPLRDEELCAASGGSSATLLRKCATGEHFDEATLTVSAGSGSGWAGAVASASVTT